MKTFFYIDGFNFYYSAVKGTPLRWIDFRALFTRLFPRSQIACIKYFTAEVDALPGDPQQPLRPQAYWWALRTLPDFEIHLGHFRPRRTRAKVVNPPPNTIEVYKTEEKGSDVNLAAHLLTDGFRNRYECAIVVSGGGTVLENMLRRMPRSDRSQPPAILQHEHRGRARHDSAGDLPRCARHIFCTQRSHVTAFGSSRSIQKTFRPRGPDVG